MKRSFVLLLATLLVTSVAWAAETNPVDQVKTALAALDGFTASYKAESAGGTSFDIRVRFRSPNLMRVDIEPLNATTTFDGHTYVYFDRKQQRAIIMQATAVQGELAKQHAFFEGVSWFSPVGEKTGGATVIYPNVILRLDETHLDVALEMSTHPYRHSWVQDLADGRKMRRRGNAVEFEKAGSEGPIRVRVGTESGMLIGIEAGEPEDVVGTIKLVKFERTVPDATLFDTAVPSSANIRDHASDPSLMQQLLITSFRNTLGVLLGTSREKWATLSDVQKAELRETCLASFKQIFELAGDTMRENVHAAMMTGELPGKIRAAAGSQVAKTRFAGDHPELTGEALDDAWKKQVIDELSQELLIDMMRSMEGQLVGPIREQALEQTATMPEAQRKEIARLVTEPAHEAFTKLTGPVVKRAIREILCD
ncbi:MAG: hypothetical protein P9L99_19370 [Candidatus Lernaella stagnicola]|nr:hypothetical protein [Candidatus Lernaella stagnicola]